MPRRSAGIVLYRRTAGEPEVLLLHPGGPFWANKDAGAWSIPKGEHDPDEDPLEAALREFTEETGVSLEVDRDAAVELGTVRQKGGKVVAAWGVEGDVDASHIRSNTFTLEWPPRSGRVREFPEVDRAEWFDPATACAKVNPAQSELIVRLMRDVLHVEEGASETSAPYADGRSRSPGISEGGLAHPLPASRVDRSRETLE